MKVAVRLGCLFPVLLIWTMSCAGEDENPSGGPGVADVRGSETAQGEAGSVCQADECLKEDAVCPEDKDCTWRLCGPDPVCGMSCGACWGNESCLEGECVACIPSCAGTECGNDGCGGVCGTCGAGICRYGQCLGERGGSTWLDPSSGLTWQARAPDSSFVWEDAKSYCETLSLGDHSDWRLPTIGEIRTLLDGCPATETGGSCGAKDDCLEESCADYTCAGCSNGGGSGLAGMYTPEEMEGDCCVYWSSSPVDDGAEYAWAVMFHTAYVGYDLVSNRKHIYCVR